VNIFDKIVNNIRRIPPSYLLLIILFIGFILRTAAWCYLGFRGNDNSEFETLARLFAQGDWKAYFAMGRFHQPTTTLLLTPVYYFHLPLASYTFWLHQLLALGTIYLVYLIAKRSFGVYFGLISAFFIAINAMIIFWFPWITGDIPFHFFLALFGLGATSLFRDKKPINYGFFFLSGFLCLLTRPEGFFIFFTAVLIMLYIHFSKRLSPVKSICIIAGIILFLSSSLVSTLFLHQKSREFFFSSMHVAYSLYVSSKISTNSPQEQEQVYNSMGEVVEKTRNQPGFVSPNYALSMYGLNFIKEHPFTWLKMYVLRFTSVVFPSVFSPWWTVKHRIYDFSMSFILVIGSIVALFFNDSRRYLALILTLMAFTIPFMVSFFQREVDLRVQLSMFILFATIAPYGWYKFYSHFSERFAHG